MTDTVRKVSLPPQARSLCSLPRIDYWDAFVAETEQAQDLTADDWIRKVLEAAPLRFRVTAPVTWFSLGLKHGLPWSSENMLGWPVRRREADFILLGAESRAGMPAELLLMRRADSLLFCTFIQHQRSAMRRIWAAVEPPHQRIVPALLRRAVRPS